jgi:hypothetical protein
VPPVARKSAIAPSGTTFSIPVNAVPPGLTVVGKTWSGVVDVGVTVVGLTVSVSVVEPLGGGELELEGGGALELEGGGELELEGGGELELEGGGELELEGGGELELEGGLGVADLTRMWLIAGKGGPGSFGLLPAAHSTMR